MRMDQEQEALSDGAQDFVARLLVVEPSERLSAYDALQHPWIVQHRATAQAADQNMNLVASVLRQLKRFQRCVVARLCRTGSSGAVVPAFAGFDHKLGLTWGLRRAGTRCSSGAC